MQRLSNAGTDHRKFMRMLPVYVRITAPLYWWKEFDTYKVGTVANSCSTMHKIQAKEFTMDDFSCEHLMGGYLEQMRRIIDDLNNARKYFTVGDQFFSPGNKRDWWQMIQLLPSSYNQTRNVMMNFMKFWQTSISPVRITNWTSGGTSANGLKSFRIRS